MIPGEITVKIKQPILWSEITFGLFQDLFYVRNNSHESYGFFLIGFALHYAGSKGKVWREE